MRTKTYIRICAMLLLAVLTAVSACRSSKISPSMRDIERTSAKNARSPHERKAAKVTQQKEDKERAEKEKRRKEGLKRHESIQTKEVKERLKAHRAASDKRYARKKEFFLKRWFSKH